jgi:ABC-type nitrate/sulfonate/bicarbonate transport system substrate-binding protein
MRNDGINLILRRSVAAARRLSRSQPLADRLRGLSGLRIGVAPGPRARLAALFRSAGVGEPELVLLTGQEQNEALANGRVDALFAHTPFLERALVEEDAVMLVNLSAGDAPRLAARQIHALCVHATLAEEVAARLVRAIARAEALVRKDLEATVRAVLRTPAATDERRLRAIVKIYRPAIPATPAVSQDGIRQALGYYPTGKVPPALPRDLSPYLRLTP